jgi:hypothetical protein
MPCGLMTMMTKNHSYEDGVCAFDVYSLVVGFMYTC